MASATTWFCEFLNSSEDINLQIESIALHYLGFFRQMNCT